MNSNERPTVGVAFGGGAIRGLAHVGALRALLDAGIPIDYLAGTSIGAWVAAHYALFQDIELLEEYAAGKKREKLQAFLEPSMKGLIAGEKAAALMNEWMGAETTFTDLHIPTTIVATNYATGAEVHHAHGALVPAVMASMALPIVFRPVEIEGHHYIDGGVVNPLPVNVVREMGADIIIAIDLDPFEQVAEAAATEEEADQVNMGLRDIARRSMLIMQHQLKKQYIGDDTIVINPGIDMNGFRAWRYYFSGDSVDEMTERGQQATEQYIPELRHRIFGEK